MENPGGTDTERTPEPIYCPRDYDCTCDLKTGCVALGGKVLTKTMTRKKDGI